MLYKAGLTVPWGRPTRIFSRLSVQVVPLTQTYACVGVCGLIDVCEHTL